MVDGELQFDWDDEKARSNLRKHGVSFPKAAAIFRNPVVESIDMREDYGEVRYLGLGRVNAQIYQVVYTRPGDKRIRIISAWRASLEDEEIYYRDVFPLRD